MIINNHHGNSFGLVFNLFMLAAINLSDHALNAGNLYNLFSHSPVSWPNDDGFLNCEKYMEPIQKSAAHILLPHKKAPLAQNGSRIVRNLSRAVQYFSLSSGMVD